jgi:hypothetical protein
MTDAPRLRRLISLFQAGKALSGLSIKALLITCVSVLLLGLNGQTGKRWFLEPPLCEPVRG